MTGGGVFDAYQLMDLREEMDDKQKDQDDVNAAKLKGLVRDLDFTNWFIILCAKITGAWLNVGGNKVKDRILLVTKL